MPTYGYLDSGESRKVKILFEEVFYNKDDKSFKVLCINIPLVGDYQVPSSPLAVVQY